MKAVRLHGFGGPENLKFEEVPDPVVGQGEVIVRVKGCALNHLDLWLRRGTHGYGLALPHILGADVSGTVEEVGSGVTGYEKGDEVIVQPGISCGLCPRCLAGDDNLCDSYIILGAGRDGGYAEFIKVPSVNLIPKPKGLDLVSAAAIPLCFLTAYHMLVTQAELKPGETVLILGAGSGVGSAAIQIAKLFSAEVIATASSEQKLKAAAELGADHLINHTRSEIHEEVKRITNGRNADIVFEHVGEATWRSSLASLAKGGRLVTCGATTGPNVSLDLRFFYMRKLRVIGSFMGRKDELIGMMRFFESGRLRPVVDRVLPLEEAARAHEILENREHFGKILLAP